MIFRKFICLVVALTFLCSLVTPVTKVHAENFSLPVPGAMVNLSPAYAPILIKGLKVHPENPMLFDFILDTGDDSSLRPKAGVIASEAKQSLEDQSNKLIKYFLATLTIPENDLWVTY